MSSITIDAFALKTLTFFVLMTRVGHLRGNCLGRNWPTHGLRDKYGKKSH